MSSIQSALEIFKKGVEKEVKEGELKGKIGTALAMFAEGDSIEKIARVTRLSLETLKEKLAVQPNIE